ncbi:hypothetical protein Psi02_74070 [Planotetraspora silvatica]|uniref:Uncharacterized protein n=1 Tax=Planotetraspora silvatica TaxID=234614 RepID=A0A8J3URY2_9ACTN|nr:hypothetical protein [Planotetraspora silvatica]GII50983.1 hypothetical protein Psi02_74070 [Planotetraspora silvatica]
MRHFFGFLAGVVVAAGLLVGGGWAAQELGRGVSENLDPVSEPRMLIALGVTAVLGVLVGLPLAMRASPLVTFVPAVALLAWTVVYALDVSSAIGIAPTGAAVHPELALAGKGMITLLSTGVYGLLGTAMFIPILMPSRWPASPRDEEEEPEDKKEEEEETFGFWGKAETPLATPRK